MLQINWLKLDFCYKFCIWGLICFEHLTRNYCQNLYHQGSRGIWLLLFWGLLFSFCLFDLLLLFATIKKKKPNLWLHWQTLLVELSCHCQAVPTTGEGHCITLKVATLTVEDEGVDLGSACGGPYPLCVGSAACIPAALCGDGAPAPSKAPGARGIVGRC